MGDLDRTFSHNRLTFGRIRKWPCRGFWPGLKWNCLIWSKYTHHLLKRFGMNQFIPILLGRTLELYLFEFGLLLRHRNWTFWPCHICKRRFSRSFPSHDGWEESISIIPQEIVFNYSF